MDSRRVSCGRYFGGKKPEPTVLIARWALGRKRDREGV